MKMRMRSAATCSTSSTSTSGSASLSRSSISFRMSLNTPFGRKKGGLRSPPSGAAARAADESPSAAEYSRGTGIEGGSGLHQERHRTVVHELHRHARSEPSAGRAEALAHRFVERFRDLRRRRLDEARPVALARVAVAMDVRDERARRAHIGGRQFHFPVAVFELTLHWTIADGVLG